MFCIVRVTAQNATDRFYDAYAVMLGRGAIENGTGIMKKTYEKPQLVAAGSLARNTAIVAKVTRVFDD